MFKKITVLLMLFFVLFAAGLSAMNDDFGSSDDTRKPERERKLEGWYHMLMLGIVPGLKIEESDGKDIQSGYFSTRVAVDFLRFYLPANEKIMFGVGIFGTGFTSDSGSSSLFSYLYSASVQFYFDYIGKGLYLRGDAGLSNAIWKKDDAPTYSVSYGFLTAIGYALPVSQEMSLMFEIGYRHLDIKGSRSSEDNLTIRSIYLTAGWLW